MIRHLFKMIWNKKKQNALLISEILISFLVLFAVFTLLVFNYQHYKKPMGFEYENVWQVSYSNALQGDHTDSLVVPFYESLKQKIKSLSQVKEISFVTANTPFSNNTNQTGLKNNNRDLSHINWYMVEDGYKEVVQAQLLEGRWFSKEDMVSKNKHIVINATLKEELFGKQEAVGKLVGDDKDKKEIIGVVQDMKVNGDYSSAGFAVYDRVDTGTWHRLGRILLRVAPGSDAAFEARLYKILANTMKNSNIEIQHLADMRKTINYYALVPMVVLLIVAVFLVINVALGLFGVLWYNINKRRGEIGLRRAVGATGQAVTLQLIGEALVVASISLLAGIFLAVQFPLLNLFDLPSNTYFIALGLSIVFIYLLVLICALYPGRQAAAVYPAVALHED